MNHIVSGGALNSTHSLTLSQSFSRSDDKAFSVFYVRFIKITNVHLYLDLGFQVQVHEHMRQ